MHHEHIASHKRTILVPKTQFATQLEAEQHARDMGYQTQRNPNHITDNFYRYHQKKPAQDYKYRETQMNKGRIKAVTKYQDHENTIISKDYHKLLDHESLLKGELPKTQSIYNSKIKTNANIVNHDRMLGRDGRGIWKQQYQQSPMTDLTPMSVVKPWVQQRADRIQYEAMIQPRKSQYDLTGNSKMAKKYF